MSARFRAKQQTMARSYADVGSLTDGSDIVPDQLNWNTSADVTQSEANGTTTTMVDIAYGLPIELYRAMQGATLPANEQYIPIVNDVKDHIDYTVGGNRGAVMRSPNAPNGPVHTDGVENFALTGEQAIIRRPHGTQGDGPVATSDANAFLAMAYGQQVNQFYPSEKSQVSLIHSV